MPDIPRSGPGREAQTISRGTTTVASYLQWNDAIASRFFRPEAAGTQVYLQVTDHLMSELGETLGGGRDDFIAAVLVGPPWATRSGLCQRGLQAMSAWRDHGREYPPYIAHLAAFVLAAGLDGNYAPHAYYPRLHDLLGTPTEHMPPSFDRMYELWEDLETWSNHDRNGELGIFRARSIGGFIHVGYPLAQAILTESERAALPRIFADAGFDPSWPPPRGEVARQVRAKGRNVLRTRTMESLAGPVGEARDVVVDAILEELEGGTGNRPWRRRGARARLGPPSACCVYAYSSTLSHDRPERGCDVGSPRRSQKRPSFCDRLTFPICNAPARSVAGLQPCVSSIRRRNSIRHGSTGCGEQQCPMSRTKRSSDSLGQASDSSSTGLARDSRG